MVLSLTAIILGGQLALSSPSETATTIPVQPIPVQPYVAHAPYIAQANFLPYEEPTKNPTPTIPEHSKYFIRMDELFGQAIVARDGETPFDPYRLADAQKGYFAPSPNHIYRSRHQLLRVTRENRNNSWQPKESPQKKRKARVKNN